MKVSSAHTCFVAASRAHGDGAGARVTQLVHRTRREAPSVISTRTAAGLGPAGSRSPKFKFLLTSSSCVTGNKRCHRCLPWTDRLTCSFSRKWLSTTQILITTVCQPLLFQGKMTLLRKAASSACNARSCPVPRRRRHAAARTGWRVNLASAPQG